MSLEAAPLGATALLGVNEQQQQQEQQQEPTPPQSPVEVAVNIRKELAEFQQPGRAEAWREEIREALKAALLQQAAGYPSTGDLGTDQYRLAEYLEERGFIRRRTGRRSNRRSKSTSAA